MNLYSYAKNGDWASIEKEAVKLKQRHSLSSSKDLPITTADDGNTALHEACQQNAPFTTICALLQLEPESALMYNEEGDAAYHLLFVQKQLELEMRAEREEENDDIDESPVDAKVIQALLRANPELASTYNPNHLSQNMIHPAVLGPDGLLAILQAYTPEMMKDSLESFDIKDITSTTILHLACRYLATTSPNLIEKMLDCLPPNIATLKDVERNRTPLHWACCAYDTASSSSSLSSQIYIDDDVAQKNNAKVVKMFLQRNPYSALLQDGRGFTPLHVAVRYSAPLSVVETLVSSEYGRSITQIENSYGITPLHEVMDFDPSFPSTYTSLLISILVRANPRAAHMTNRHGLSPYRRAASRASHIIVDYCRAFLFHVRLTYRDDFVQEIFDKKRKRWSEEGRLEELQYLTRLANTTSENLDEAQKYLDYLSIFMAEAGQIDDNSNNDAGSDDDEEPPHVRECRRQNFASVIEMWDILRSVLEEVERRNDQNEYGKNAHELKTFASSKDNLLLKMSFQIMLCTCLKMAVVPFVFVLFLLKIAPKRKNGMSTNDNNAICGESGASSEAKETSTEQEKCDIPLHIALNQLKKTGISFQTPCLIQELVKMNPAATKVRDSNGQFPLTLIANLDAQWDDGVKDIFLANPFVFFDHEDGQINKARLGRGDKEKDRSPLIPFVLERISKEGAFDAMYEIMRGKPEFTSF